jgi:hypothetical protein
MEAHCLFRCRPDAEILALWFADAVLAIRLARRTCQAKRRVGAPSLGTLNSRNVQNLSGDLSDEEIIIAYEERT